ncbi:MAG: hypothetical protein HFI38_03305 [Lachnospiraceae bacterium]|jgi:hypothetical protein|nr:hypothetical protein [Lachnospiraceae bacterium]
MKLNEIVFLGFTKAEIARIRKEIGKTGDEKLDLNFGQEVADILGFDVGTLILPRNRAAMVKMG